MPTLLNPRVAAATLLAVQALGLSGCSDGLTPEQGMEPITELPRDLTVTERSVIEGSNDFGFGLFSRVVAEDTRPNVLLSPLSASMALGMTLNGAEDATFDAMRSALAFGDLSREEINASYRSLIDMLTELDPEVDFEIANAIWANQGVPFREAFFQTVSAAFSARVESGDFADPATLAAINAWVAERTGGLIDSILDDLDPALVMLLVNAIYFDGSWTTQFDPSDTRAQTFTRPDGTTVQVDMMRMRDTQARVAGHAGWSAVELPYGGGEAFAMVVVLPRNGTSARDLAAALDATAWDGLVGSLVPAELSMLGLPKLTLDYDAFLNDALRALGMDIAFGPGADFSRMSPLGDEMCIDFVRQKTFVEVDERGTRAAAVTSVGVGITSLPPSFVVDRPFVFAIRERLSGTILFVGLVEDPTATDPGPAPVASDCR